MTSGPSLFGYTIWWLLAAIHNPRALHLPWVDHLWLFKVETVILWIREGINDRGARLLMSRLGEILIQVVETYGATWKMFKSSDSRPKVFL